MGDKGTRKQREAEERLKAEKKQAATDALFEFVEGKFLCFTVTKRVAKKQIKDVLMENRISQLAYQPAAAAITRGERYV
jgi:hypothetical protein